MIPLYDHQKKLVEICREHPRFGIFWEPGVCKTIGAYAVMSDQKARGFIGKTVVLAPKSILHSAWANDGKHFTDLKIVVCWHQSPAKRKALIATPGADVLVTTYECFKRDIEAFKAAGVTRLIVDESSKLRDGETQISQKAFTFAMSMKSVYLLSGTPAPNDETEYWAQMRCVDAGMFGTSFWKFAYQYFIPIKVKIGDKEHIKGWRMKPQMADAFFDKLRTKSWTLRATDCIDLPPETDVIREVTLSDEENAYYDQIAEEMAISAKNGERIRLSGTGPLLKLRQCTGGAVYGAGREVHEVGRSKLDAMLEVLEELGDRQAVVWAEFTSEIDRIVLALDDLQPGLVGRIDGQVDQATRTRFIEDFQAGRLRYLVCHPAAAGHGITLTAARYDVFYSLGYFPENHEQARRRIYRNSQRWPVTHYYLICPGTVDEKAFRVIKRKATAVQMVKDMLAEMGINQEVDELSLEAAEVF